VIPLPMQLFPPVPEAFTGPSAGGLTEALIFDWNARGTGARIALPLDHHHRTPRPEHVPGGRVPRRWRARTTLAVSPARGHVAPKPARSGSSSQRSGRTPDGDRKSIHRWSHQPRAGLDPKILVKWYCSAFYCYLTNII
jgi:hypothetical protein